MMYVLRAFDAEGQLSRTLVDFDGRQEAASTIRAKFGASVKFALETRDRVKVLDWKQI